MFASVRTFDFGIISQTDFYFFWYVLFAIIGTFRYRKISLIRFLLLLVFFACNRRNFRHRAISLKRFLPLFSHLKDLFSQSNLFSDIYRRIVTSFSFHVFYFLFSTPCFVIIVFSISLLYLLYSSHTTLLISYIAIFLILR